MVVGTEWGRVRSLRGTGGAATAEVLPGQPAEIAGLKGLPQAGDQLLVRRGHGFEPPVAHPNSLQYPTPGGSCE